MSSQIDETLPIFGEPLTASVRANFATAKAEISALQLQTTGAPFLPLAGGIMTGPMYLYNDPTDVMMPATKGYVDAHAGGGDGGGGIPEAPADANTYGRHAGAWLPVLPMTGGTLTGLLTLSGPPVGSLDAATKAYVDAAIAAAPYAPLASPALTGIPTAPTPALTDNTTTLATTAYVKGQNYQSAAQVAATYAPLASPTFTGNPHAPTPATGVNDTTIATAAFVKAQGYTAGGPFLPLLGGEITGALQIDGSLTIGTLLTSSNTGGVFTISATPTITGVLTAAAGVNASGGTLTVGPTMNFGGTGGTCTINGQAIFSGTPSFNAGLATFNTIGPGGDNSCAVGATGRAFNQMNSYNWFTASDRREKIDIAALPPCLEVVRQLAPQSYHLATGDDHRTHWGFIAQDVDAAMTAAGHLFGGHVVGENGREALSYNDLLATLWQALRELADEIAELREAR